MQRLEGFVTEHEALTAQLSSGSLKSHEIAPLAQRLTEIDGTYNIILERQRASEERLQLGVILKDTPRSDDMHALVASEIDTLTKQVEAHDATLRGILQPRDPLANHPAMVEIRAGAGGDEAALFVRDLLRLYMRYAEAKGWSIEIIDMNETDLGGCKEAIFVLRGRTKVYGTMQYEAGVHRVQRVPQTESSGRLHTSTVTVAVLPEISPAEFQVEEKDLRVETFRARGAGGQHVNTTDSAVRIVHIPTGVTVQCQDEKSQHRNKDRALSVLRSRLYTIEAERQRAEDSANRRAQIGGGDRAERIRTYNFPQNRITDHRVGLTLRRLDVVIDGELDLLLDPLAEMMQEQALLDAPT
ncbi:MAG: peptide chain release factor 1 [Alphaproteobacteria bacterium]|nr:peptide chain release factor 1 [Alphaproteobacteria bacterium]